MARTVNHAKRAARRSEILAAAFACFVDKGFHATSMQDICAAAKMSPGALYRYFASKDDIIIAIVEEDRNEYRAIIAMVETTEDLAGTLSEIAGLLIEEATEPGFGELSAEVFAEALRNEDARRIVVDADRAMRTALTNAIRAEMARGKLEPTMDARRVGGRHHGSAGRAGGPMYPQSAVLTGRVADDDLADVRGAALAPLFAATSRRVDARSATR